MRRTIMLVGVLVLGSAGCGTSAPETETPDAPAATTAQESSPEAETSQEPAPTTDAASPTEDAQPETKGPEAGGDQPMSDRGNMVMEVGELATANGRSGETIAEFTLTEIETDFSCPSDIADEPANGTYVALTFDVKTYPALANEEFTKTFAVTPYEMSVFSPDGTRENDSSGNALFCLDPADSLPNQMGPGERATGKIVLDTANESGTVVFKTYLVDGPGWEWNY